MVQIAQMSELAKTLSALKSYQSIKPQTGAVVNNIKYLLGNPRQYRFNGQNGRFNINGIKDLGNSLDFSPVAWRIFYAELFGRKNRDLWAELFFIDTDNCVCSIMFNNTSAQILQTMLSQLVYDGLLLESVILRVTSEKRTNEKANGTYYVAQFTYSETPPESLIIQKQYAADFMVFRQDTITDEEEITFCSDSYRSPALLSRKESLISNIECSAELT